MRPDPEAGCGLVLIVGAVLAAAVCFVLGVALGVRWVRG